MYGFHNFFPASHSASCLCDHVPIAKNFKFAFVQKTFRRGFHPHTSPCQYFLSDGYITLTGDYDSVTLYGFRFHGNLPGREIADKTDDVETGSDAWSL